MANLHVQPKRKSNLWIWLIIIILIIAAAVYYYVNYYSKGITPGSDKAMHGTPALQVNYT
jgi:flagellar basal body-associated protein FliL